MVKRSLKASSAGIIKAKQAFVRKQWSQEYLATRAGLSTRNSVWKFFAGRPIERYIFTEICFQLDLNWEEIADLSVEDEGFQAPPQSDLAAKVPCDDLVAEVRSRLQGQIEARCGFVWAHIYINQPLQLERVYTEVDVFTSLSNQRWLELSDLKSSASDFSRFDLSHSNRKTIPAIEAIANYPKLVIFGKPGSGKTTFLQHLALLCIRGEFKSDCVCIFIPLRIFATAAKATGYDLASYIALQWSSYGISSERVEILIRQGKVLVLLDGLEEIVPEDREAISAQIQQFAEVYYQNSIAIATRIGIQPCLLRGFTYVELADLNRDRIEAFVKKWFVAIARSSESEGLLKAARFLELLQRPENLPILELSATPILLGLLCSVFQERSSFPAKRSKLYQEALEILLGRWDSSRDNREGLVCSNLSLPEKIKLLSQIAATTFEQGNYFFEKSDVQNIIADCLLTLDRANTDPETLWLNSEELLRTIERQYGLIVERAKGIYSFSHLTFQEYLAARKIVASPDAPTLQAALKSLAARVAEPQWREVILLTLEMLPSADYLIEQLKERVDLSLKAEPGLQRFLYRIDRKVKGMDLAYQPAALRAFYFGLLHGRDLNLATSIDPKLASNIAPELALDVAFMRAWGISLQLLERQELEQILELGLALDLQGRLAMDRELDRAVRELKRALPDPAEGIVSLQSWWKTNGRVWRDRLKDFLEEHRHLSLDWHFEVQKPSLWEDYYRTNQFLVECLDSQCQLSPIRRAAIVESLLSC